MSQNVHPSSLASSLASAAEAVGTSTSITPASSSTHPAPSPIDVPASPTTPAAPTTSLAQPRRRWAAPSLAAPSLAAPSLAAPSLAAFTAPSRLRWIRLIASLLLVITLASVLLTLKRNLDLRFNHKSFIGIGAGCLQFGFNEDRYWFTQNNDQPDTSISPLFDLAITPTYYTDWTLAWRPFRVKTVGSTFIVAPLWPLVFASLTLAAWSHGHLAGLRAARTTSCQSCGYDLTGIAANHGCRTCPECGKTQPTT